MAQHAYALITGASSGLGVDFAEILAQQGYNLILVARREHLLQEQQRKLASKFAVDVCYLTADLAQANAAQVLYERVAELGLKVEVLINNAGFGLYGHFVEIPWERQAQMMQLDMVTLTQLTQLYAKDMARQGKGYILLVSSIGAYQPTPTYATYAAAKSYVLHFAEALNYELRHSGVKVTALSPGITATEFLQVSGQKATLYQRIAMMQSRPVAQIGIKAMFKGKQSVVPGLANKVTAFSTRFMPRCLMTSISSRLMGDGDSVNKVPAPKMC